MFQITTITTITSIDRRFSHLGVILDRELNWKMVCEVQMLQGSEVSGNPDFINEAFFLLRTKLLFNRSYIRTVMTYAAGA
jgi:hypothetical protein